LCRNEADCVDPSVSWHLVSEVALSCGHWVALVVAEGVKRLENAHSQA
jgi:hypothetical protein